MTAEVLYVVPTYNRARDLPRTLHAIAAQDWDHDRMAILVVDGGSQDATQAVVEALARTLPCRIELLRKANEGPAVSRNAGLARGLGRFVAVVDSDVALDPGWTRATVAAMQDDPGLAQVGGRLVFGHAPTILNSYGGELGRGIGLAWDFAEGQRADDQHAPRDTLWINTSAVLFRPEPVLAVGAFDPAFMMAYEEPDLGLRLAIAGWRARVVPDAVALHHVGPQSLHWDAEMVFHQVKNRIRLGLKSLGALRLCGFVSVNLLYGLADAALHRHRGARLRGMWWNLVNIAETWRLRRKAQALRRVPDRQALAPTGTAWLPPTRLHGRRRRAMPGMFAASAPDDR